MPSHKQRMDEIGVYANPRMQKIANDYAKSLGLDKCPNFKKSMNRAFRKAVATIEAQISNGAGFPIDDTLRYFLAEYNNRNFSHGLNSMPSSFNVMEAFYEYKPEISFFKLREEKDHLFLMPEYIDYVTSPSVLGDIKSILDYLEEGVIYSYNIINDVEDFTFSSGKEEYAVGGVSLIRHGTEINVLVLGGKKTILSEVEKEFLVDYDKVDVFPGRENIKPSDNFKREVVPLFGNTNFWQLLALTRIDVEDGTFDVRYILRDLGNTFGIVTDDVNAYLDSKREFVNPELEEVYEEFRKKIAEYNILFEVCKSMIFLPVFFWQYGDLIVDERHQTKLFKEIGKVKWLKKKKLVEPKENVGHRIVSVLKKEDSVHPSNIIYFAPEIKIQRSGFWKKLPPNKIGKTKKGHKIHGKTWVEKTLSWIEQSESQGQVKAINRKSTHNFETQNGGYIYVMRSPSDKKDIYKVGFTSREPEKRATEITKGTGVPAEYLVVEDWEVRDCIIAERMIHDALDNFRINPKREFFKVPYKDIRVIIENIVEKINAS